MSRSVLAPNMPSLDRAAPRNLDHAAPKARLFAAISTLSETADAQSAFQAEPAHA